MQQLLNVWQQHSYTFFSHHIESLIRPRGAIFWNSIREYCEYPFLWLGFNYLTHFNVHVSGVINFQSTQTSKHISNSKIELVWKSLCNKLLLDVFSNKFLNWFSLSLSFHTYNSINGIHSSRFEWVLIVNHWCTFHLCILLYLLHRIWSLRLAPILFLFM